MGTGASAHNGGHGAQAAPSGASGSSGSASAPVPPRHDAGHSSGSAPPTVAPAPKAGGLASRRAAMGLGGGVVTGRKPLQVSTKKDGPRLTILERLRSHSGETMKAAHEKRNAIKWTDNFSLHYAIGAEVMPSCHQCMEVRHAMRLEDGERVVIKLRFKPGSFGSAEEQRQFRQTMEFMLNLPKSGSIAQLYEVLEDERAYYVVMEKVEGMDLFETLDSEGRFPISESRDIIRKLLTAVAELHERGFIHKDLKLENVMIGRSPKTAQSYSGWGPRPGTGQSPCSSPGPSRVQAVTPPVSSGAGSGAAGPPQHAAGAAAAPAELEPVVKLIDFDTVEEWSPNGSRARSVVGTDQYISQEAYAGKYSPASDIFAVGVITYRLVSGRFPFSNSMFDDEAGENWVGSPKMKEIQERIKRFEVDFVIPPFPWEPQVAELCSQMLAVNEVDRPTALAALAHPWLQVPGGPSRGPSVHDSRPVSPGVP